MKIIINIAKNKDLTESQKNTINKAREANWGESARKNFNKDYEPNTEWVFVYDDKKIVSFGGLRPIKINYLKKKYSIFGICSTISLVKGRAYGRIMTAGIIARLSKTGKSAIGFTEESGFFSKAGLKVEKDFIKRFVYINPKTKEKIYDSEGDGIYYEGKDKIISKILRTKSFVEIGVDFW